MMHIYIYTVCIIFSVKICTTLQKFTSSDTHMDQLLLAVVLFAAAFPVAVCLVRHLRLLLALISVHVLLWVHWW